MAKRRSNATFVPPGTDLPDARERNRGSVQASGRGIQMNTGTLEQFAEDLGRVLGVAERKVDEWLQQRGAVKARLVELRDTANQLLERLGEEVSSGRKRGLTPAAQGSTAVKRGPGRPPGSGKRKRTMSAEAREKIAAAQRARWAKQKAGKG